MKASLIKIAPKVYRADKKQTVFFHLDGAPADSSFSAKIQPMEKHSILHTPKYRIDEEDRYPCFPLTKISDGLYALDYDFTDEQRYTVRVKQDDEIIARSYLYALKEDLYSLDVFKGDTHLHTSRSDGEGTPFEVSCEYRRAGFDFIAVTDHHKFAPSLEAKAEMEPLTDRFRVFRGEEVHNHGMGCFHIINFDGEYSVNDIIETDDAYVQAEVDKILETLKGEPLNDPYSTAYRIFVSNEIRKAGGVSIMAHPYWECYGDYNVPTDEICWLWKHGSFDALEVVASCDASGNGNNLQESLWAELRSEGARIPVVGASDAHTRHVTRAGQDFARQFTLAFSPDFDGIKEAVKDERSVAVIRRADHDFHIVGRFRYVKYARFLMDEFYPAYTALCEPHADSLAAGDADSIAHTQAPIDTFRAGFFGR